MQKKNNHIVHIITGLQRGGAETVLVTLCQELAKPEYNYRQSVIFFKDGDLRDNLNALGIATYQASYFTLYTTIQQLEPDIINSSLWSANILARLIGLVLRIPVYCALHTVAEHSGMFRNYIDALLPIHPRNYIAVSASVRESYTHILPAKKIVVIENGIPERNLLPATTSATYTIGSVGRFVPVKNYDLLLRVCAKIYQDYKNIRVMLIGHGPLEQELRDQAKKLAIEHIVTFIINKPAQDYYHHFTCFVQPSAHEGLSIALLEAMQAKLPVIVTGVEEKHPCITHKKSGLVIEPNHFDTLYHALKEYILNRNTSEYAQAGYAHVQENFSARAMAQKYSNLFQRS